MPQAMLGHPSSVSQSKDKINSRKQNKRRLTPCGHTGVGEREQWLLQVSLLDPEEREKFKQRTSISTTKQSWSVWSYPPLTHPCQGFRLTLDGGLTC